MTSAPEVKTAKDSIPPGEVARVRWWVAVAMFVGGVVLGVVIAGLLIATTPDFGATAPESGTTQAPDTRQPSGGGTVPVTAEARVNAACLRVINEAQDVYRIISGIGEAASEVDLQRLDDIVQRLQPLETRLARDLPDCRVDTSIEEGSTAAPTSPVPTVPQPTTNPTR